ncbi:hypothetical protein JKF63_00043 [Porcisia hertigi]|uniref:C2HC/C3H-type domain-containing protein n=1 Tax=Porcisia hertigi TaxID=2761500 RepID=A0A836I4A0_9TRYP|nr:hypothetical protein JKF63_00043 [Porcisia hertigi]
MPRPQFITCHLCGRGFGSASINIHIPQCYEKAIKRWQLDPQGPRPVMPQLHGKPVSKASNIRSPAVSFAGQPCGSGVSAVRTLHMQSQIPESVAPENMNLHPCSKCGRKFNYDRVAYHERVCKGDRKRRVFDSSKQRCATGDADDAYAGSAFGAPTGARGGRTKKTVAASTTSRYTPAPAPRTNWRQQHEEFIAAIRSAKRADTDAQNMWGTASGGPSYGSSRGPARSGPPGISSSNFRSRAGVSPQFSTTTGRVPRLMTKQNETFKQSIAAGGRAARAKAGGGIPAPGMGRPIPPPERNSFGGGGGSRFGNRAGGSGMGGGGGRILNDNSSSMGMLQAMGRG